MDKIYKKKSPKTSTMNFLFKNKTKEDVESKSKEVTDTGRLRIESIDNIHSSSHDIDKQINELETLIKRLQDEIIEMSNELEQPLEKEQLEPEASPHHLRMKIEESETDANRKSHIYSVIINDGGLTKNTSNPFLGLQISEPIHTHSTEELEEAFTNIRRDFSLLWMDEDVASQKREDDEDIEGNMEHTLYDLKSKISEIINYQEHRLPQKKSKEKLH